jgi:hypothetical protein
MLLTKNFCTAIAAAILMSLTACGGSGSNSTTATSTGTTVVTTVADKSPVIDTSQTNTYDATSVIAAPAKGQPFYGQDAQFSGTQPSYTKSSDGLTVKDNITGLTWQASQIGGDVYWTEAETVPAALNQVSYGGYSDWRLPTIRELYSVWNGSKGWPYIDTKYFSVPYTSEQELSHAIIWSSTKYTGLLRSSIEGSSAVGAEMAFGVNFGTGHIKAYTTSIGPKHMVRAVRGPIYGTSSFVDNGNGTINDQATGLMWSQTDSGVGMDWEHALAWAQTRNGEKFLGYSDWRLPNSKELQSLVDYTRSAEATAAANVGPAISPLFKISSITNEAGATDYPYFWTSTSAGGKDGEPLVFAWYVAFGRAADAAGKDLHGAGAIRFDAKVTGKTQGQDAERVFNYVRLVRNIAATVSTTKTSYTMVGTGQTITFDATAALATAPTAGQSFYGQDAQFSGKAASYTKSADGLTVKDNITGLTWQQSPDTTGDGAIDSKDKLTWTQTQARPAVLNTASYGGHNDWRLPTIKELYSLMNFMGTDVGPGSTAATLTSFIDRNYFSFGFGDTAAGERLLDAQYASSNLYVSKTMMAVQYGYAGDETLFGVNFADGRIKGYGLTMPGSGDKTFYVRLVRGAAYGVNDFVDNGDSTISDRATGQMWTKGDSGKGMNWQEALAWAQAKNAESYLGHSDWRLPNTKELQAIVDYTRSPDTTSSAAINPLFTCTAITNEAGKQDYPFYWTNTTHLSSDGTGASAIYIAFGRAMGYMTSPTDSTKGAWVDVHGAGAQRSDPKAGNPADFPQGRGPQGDAIRIYNYVRLVRGIMRLTLHLGSISIALHGATIAL